jgi:hypothetical protein
MRLVSRRRRGDPPNPDGKDFDAFTLRFNYFLRRAQDTQLPQKGKVIRVRGFLQQRDDQESLARLLKYRAREVKPAVLNAVHDALGGQLHNIRFQRRLTEIVALEWEPLKQRRQKDAKAAEGAATAESEKEKVVVAE